MRLARAGLDSGKEVERFYGRNAVLSAGMLAGLTHDDEGAALVRGLVTPYLGGPDVRLSRLGFAAIGNLGSPDDLELITRWSRDADVDVRAQVPQALRRLPLEQVGAFEREWLERETAPDVKRELWHLLFRQLADEQRPLPDEFLTVAIKDLEAQHPALTRQTLINLLAQRIDVPAAKAALLAQAPVEFEQRSGLYGVIAEHVPADDLSRVMSPVFEATNREGAEAPTPATPSVNPPVATGVTP